MKETQYYDLFSVEPEADISEITLSYRKLAKKFHPDKNPENGEKFAEISSAYDILSGTELFFIRFLQQLFRLILNDST